MCNSRVVIPICQISVVFCRSPKISSRAPTDKATISVPSRHCRKARNIRSIIIPRPAFCRLEKLSGRILHRFPSNNFVHFAPFLFRREEPTIRANTLQRPDQSTQLTVTAIYRIILIRSQLHRIDGGSPSIKTPSDCTFFRVVVIAPTFALQARGFYAVRIVQVLCHPHLIADFYRLVNLSITGVGHFAIFDVRIQVRVFCTASGSPPFGRG